MGFVWKIPNLSLILLQVLFVFTWHFHVRNVGFVIAETSNSKPEMLSCTSSCDEILFYNEQIESISSPYDFLPSSYKQSIQTLTDPEPDLFVKNFWKQRPIVLKGDSWFPKEIREQQTRRRQTKINLEKSRISESKNETESSPLNLALLRRYLDGLTVVPMVSATSAECNNSSNFKGTKYLK